MTALHDFKSRFKAVAAPTVFAALLVYAGYYLVYGDYGLLSYREARQQLKMVSESFHRISSERKIMESRVSLLRPTGVDPDVLDERARVLLGRAHPNDFIIPIPSRLDTADSLGHPN